MDSNARKLINQIQEALKRQKRNPKERCVIDAASSIIEASKNNNEGVYISSEFIVSLINKKNIKNFKINNIGQGGALVLELFL